MVVIFQRGAADGLNVVVPYREKNYYAMRPSIAIPQNQVIDLDGFFGLHPSLTSFKPLYDAGHLAIVHAAGSPDMSRSHFDAQDFMESRHAGNQEHGRRLVESRVAGGRPESPAAADGFSRAGAWPASAAHAGGKVPAIALNNVNSFSVAGRGPAPSPAANAFEAMYGGSGDHIFHAAGEETFEAVKMLREANPAQYQPAAGVEYPNSEFGNRMKQVAQLLKSNLGVEAAFTDIGGWDTHQNQGDVDGQLSQRLRDFSDEHRGFLARHGRRCGELRW